MNKIGSKNRGIHPPCRILLISLACGILLAGAHANAKILKKSIRSEKTGRTFMIYVYIPENYESSGKSFPVLYLLDAEKHFADIAGVVERMTREGRISPLIIAGIGYESGKNMRKHDYTPTCIKRFAGSGGVESFYKFLRHELIPTLDSRYRTIPGRDGRAIAGHSLGALAVYHGLYYHSDLFAGYIAASPSLWWDSELFFRITPSWRKQGHLKCVRVFTAAGSGEHPATRQYARRITRALSEEKNRGITVLYKTIPAKDHEDAAVPAITAGIINIFPGRVKE